ncbi:MAG: AI-2E family transporter [Ruminococcus sp.]|nr:AI-2E family transporter [Ruminococcus sp.]
MKRKYIIPGLIIFLGLAVIFRPSVITGTLDALWCAGLPIITGIVITAVMNPAVNTADKFIGLFCPRRTSRRRPAAIALAYLTAAAAIAAVISIIIPRLADSIRLFVNSFDGYYSLFRERADRLIGSEGVISLFDRIAKTLSEAFPAMLGRTFTATAGFIRAAGNFLVGTVLSVYILAQKQVIMDFIGGAAAVFISKERLKKISRCLDVIYESLTNFISGQITEAVVLGTLCFAGMVLLRFEYPLLISVIIGVTALVPVVGAFAGAVPSVFVLFLAKPSSALWFIIFIIILQQVENNFIYPRIVGKSVGLPPLLILIAIIVGAQIGGAAGIMLGIPLLSAGYTLAREKLEENLNS